MPLIVITAPTSEPVSVAEAKLSPSFRMSSAADDTPIGALITAAREMGEAITKRAFMPTTFEYVLDEFPAFKVDLPCPPLVSVTSIKYTDTNGVEQTLAATEYAVLPSSDFAPGGVCLAYNKSWPGTRDVPNAVRIRYIAGYATASVVPVPIKTWITMRAGTLYVNSIGIVVGQTVMSLPRDYVDGLLDPYLVITF